MITQKILKPLIHEPFGAFETEGELIIHSLRFLSRFALSE